jgi:hypothetical protein
VTWAGSPFAQLIEFRTGLPTGAISYTLIGNAGEVLVDDQVTPDAGAVSHLLVIDGAHNTCAQPLFETRTLVFSYLTATGIVSDRVSYRVDKPIPFAASGEGVRLKLGIEPHELTDEEVDLVAAYAQLLTFGDPTPYVSSGDRNALLMVNAIEAIAALLVVGILQLKIAQREDSGTNKFIRYTGPDWLRVESDLHLHIARARQILDSSYDALGDTYQAFGKITPSPDVITGA